MRILKAKRSKYYEAALSNFEDARRGYERAGLAPKWEALVGEVRAQHRRKVGFMTGFEEVVAGGGPSARPTFLERESALEDLFGNRIGKLNQWLGGPEAPRTAGDARARCSSGSSRRKAPACSAGSSSATQRSPSKRRRSPRALGWAEDFPADAAGDAVAMLPSESRAKHRRAWLLPEAVVDQIPAWVEMIDRCSKPASGRR